MSEVRLDPVFLVYAFRYALGRQSYAVSDVARALTKNVTVLRPEWRADIILDIEVAIGEGRAGALTDVQAWRDVQAVMREANE